MKAKQSVCKGKGKGNSLFRDCNLYIIFSITLIAIMGVASISPALSIIMRELHISAQQIGLLITSFTVPGIFFTPVLGLLADHFGRKRIVLPSLFIFALAGSACALTHDFYTLLLLRFVQGIGGAVLPAITITLIGDLYTGQERDAAMGYNASVLSLGVAFYPVLGGFLASIHWQYLFFLPLLALPVGFFVLFQLKAPEPESLNTHSFSDYLSGMWHIIQQPEAVVLLLVSLTTFILLYGSYLTYFSLLLSQNFNASPKIIGLIMSGMACTMACTASQMGRLTTYYSKKQLLLTAYILYAVALYLIPLVPNILVLLLPIILLGIAQGLNVPTIHTLLTTLAPQEYRASFISINNMVFRLGQTLGPLIMALFFIFWGTDGVYFAGAGCAVLMLIPLALVL
ncbi:MAG: MFS transporter [Candidatus Electrothrix sp. AW1]|jgi:MFS transporter, ACDE family, multidrug resistance protein|nr:MFS transporter [Candidatus Electrothrix sp. AX1]MCI5183230.1 MFS transporter [Candidatus Electrothrix gigas]